MNPHAQGILHSPVCKSDWVFYLFSPVEAKCPLFGSKSIANSGSLMRSELLKSIAQRLERNRLLLFHNQKNGCSSCGQSHGVSNCLLSAVRTGRMRPCCRG